MKSQVEAMRLQLEERKLVIDEFRAETERIKVQSEIVLGERQQLHNETSAAMQAEERESAPAA